jgi:hypothetical protein
MQMGCVARSVYSMVGVVVNMWEQNIFVRTAACQVGLVTTGWKSPHTLAY